VDQGLSAFKVPQTPHNVSLFLWKQQPPPHYGQEKKRISKHADSFTQNITNMESYMQAPIMPGCKQADLADSTLEASEVAG